MKYVVVAAILCTVAVAGCTSPLPSFPGGPQKTQTNNTSSQEQAADGLQTTLTLERGRMYERSANTLTLSMRNGRDRSLDNVTVDIGNHGRLGLVRQVPSQGQQGLRQHQCRYDVLRAGSGMQRCIWKVLAGDGVVGELRDEIAVPLTAFVTYDNGFMISEGTDISFARDRDIDPGTTRTVQVSGRNPDMSLSVSHDQPVTAGDRAVEFTFTVRNVGQGRVAGQADRVHLTYSGTLADAAWDRQASTCVDDGAARKVKTVSLDDGEKTITCSVVLQDGRLADKTFFLTPQLHYTYMVTDKAPVTVAARQD